MTEEGRINQVDRRSFMQQSAVASSAAAISAMSAESTSAQQVAATAANFPACQSPIWAGRLTARILESDCGNVVNRWIRVFASCMLFGAASTAMSVEPADLILLGGKIVTMDDKGTVAEALAITRDRILAVGTDADISQLRGDKTRTIDLRGRLTVPGFIEGHGHFVGLGESKMMLDLRSAKTWKEITNQVEQASRSAPPGQWIMGRGWHQEKWVEPTLPNVDGYPVHTDVSAVSPHNPVLLTHASGHMCFANAKAMELAGVNVATRDPNGGQIVRDSMGNPTGVFRETAQALIKRAHVTSERTLSDEQRKLHTLEAIKLATQECLENGVTSFHDAGSSFETIDTFKKLAAANELKVRLWVMVRESNGRLAQRLPYYRLIGHANNFLTVRAIKRSIDGALGPHGAWLLAPYEDLDSSTGLNTTTLESIIKTAEIAVQHDFQLCVHAIGDRANRETLNIFADTFRAFPGDTRRWRVEHAQHLHPDDIPRFAKLGVIASMQGIHCTSDAVYVVQRLGQRRAAEGAYVWRDLLDSDAIVINGTDAPVEDLSPIDCFYATVTRRLPSGVTFFPEQRMTRAEALRSYTLAAAYGAFEEDLKGSLEAGKLADIVVLSKDIMTCPENEIRQATVVHTIVGGKVLFSTGSLR